MLLLLRIPEPEYRMSKLYVEVTSADSGGGRFQTRSLAWLYINKYPSRPMAPFLHYFKLRDEALLLTCHESWKCRRWTNFGKPVIVVWNHVFHSLLYNFTEKWKKKYGINSAMNGLFSSCLNLKEKDTSIGPWQTWPVAGSEGCPGSWTACTCSFHEVGFQ